MEKRELHSELSEFISCMSRLEIILARHGNVFWSEKVARVRQIAEKSDGYCLKLFSSYLGGAGSLSDVIIDFSDSDDTEFQGELERASALARKLQSPRQS